MKVISVVGARPNFMKPLSDKNYFLSKFLPLKVHEQACAWPVGVSN